MELAAGADAELGEDLGQVVLDGVRADEQPGADLRVGQAVPGKQRDLHLLGGQLPAGPGRGVGAARAGGFPGGEQLPAGPFCESFHPDLVQHLVSDVQLLTRVTAAALAAQPLAVEQVAAGQFRAEPGTAKPVDRFPVQAIGLLALGHQRA